ncbi:hypothetical protein Tco_0587019 [Tanacetum coccineum]
MNQQAISTHVVQSHGNPLDGNILFMFNGADLLVLFALSVTFVKPSAIEMAQKYNAGQIPTELVTIVVDAILEKLVNSEGASNSKEDTPDGKMCTWQLAVGGRSNVRLTKSWTPAPNSFFHHRSAMSLRKVLESIPKETTFRSFH